MRKVGIWAWTYGRDHHWRESQLWTGFEQPHALTCFNNLWNIWNQHGVSASGGLQIVFMLEQRVFVDSFGFWLFSSRWEQLVCVKPPPSYPTRACPTDTGLRCFGRFVQPHLQRPRLEGKGWGSGWISTCNCGKWWREKTRPQTSGVTSDV